MDMYRLLALLRLLSYHLTPCGLTRSHDHVHAEKQMGYDTKGIELKVAQRQQSLIFFQLKVLS